MARAADGVEFAAALGRIALLTYPHSKAENGTANLRFYHFRIAFLKVSFSSSALRGSESIPTMRSTNSTSARSTRRTRQSPNKAPLQRAGPRKVRPPFCLASLPLRSLVCSRTPSLRALTLSPTPPSTLLTTHTHLYPAHCLSCASPTVFPRPHAPSPSAPLAAPRQRLPLTGVPFRRYRLLASTSSAPAASPAASCSRPRHVPAAPRRRC